ncbi:MULTISPECIES: DUF6069 family protein [Mumia]|uniref:DUF6069 family protein n=1 Tax=Mumia TaxID=1546255 RepID=UPI00141D7493|nr:MULTISPECIES: DUF6069 family protein [unclassified Mumia]QMW65212.1 hypothetical protein H4N58_13445 [Mumia sp. ZJ1417]
MSYQQPPAGQPEPGTPSGLSVDAGKLWAGGVATAVVAALAAAVGLLVCRGVFDIAVLVPSGGGRWDVTSTLPYAFLAAGAALLATGLMHLLLLTTPRPRLFFGWIVALIAVIIGVLPFTVDIPLEEQVASAAVGVLITVIIGSLVSGTAQRAVRNAPRA